MVSVSQHNKSKKSPTPSTSSTSSKKKFGVVKRLQKQGGWTDEEDELLLQAVKKYKERNWTKIAQSVPNRTATQCLHRFKKVLDPNISKSPWTDEEDQRLLDLVEMQDTLSWTVISAQMPNRNAKQIRERYMNHLAPGIKKGVWDQKELDILVEAQKKLGNKWSKISQLVEGRSPNACKNQFHAYQQRLKKGIKPRKTKTTLNPPAPQKPVKNPKKKSSSPQHSSTKDALDRLAMDELMDEGEINLLLPPQQSSDQVHGMTKTVSSDSLNSMQDIYLQSNCAYTTGGDPMPISPEETQPPMAFPQQAPMIYTSFTEGAPITWIAQSHMTAHENSWVPVSVYQQPTTMEAVQTAQYYVGHQAPRTAPPVQFVHRSIRVPSSGGTPHFQTPAQYAYHRHMAGAPIGLSQIGQPHLSQMGFQSAATAQHTHHQMCSCGCHKQPTTTVTSNAGLVEDTAGFPQYFNTKEMTQQNATVAESGSVSPLKARVNTVFEDLHGVYHVQPSFFHIAQSHQHQQQLHLQQLQQQQQQLQQQQMPTRMPSHQAALSESNLTPGEFSISPLPTNFGDTEMMPYGLVKDATEFSDFSSAVRRVDPVEFTSSIPDEFINADEDNFHFLG